MQGTSYFLDPVKRTHDEHCIDIWRKASRPFRIDYRVVATSFSGHSCLGLFC